MSGTATVSFEEAESVATIRIDDGKANAFNEGLLSALSDALDVAIAQDRAALIVGRKGFLSAGFDLSVMRGDASARKNLVLAGLSLALKIFEAPIPVVVCCTGHAIAAGTLLLLPADHVLVGDVPVKIGFNETTIGIELSPFVLELARYRLLPAAYNQILRGSLYDAVAAQKAGYVDEVVASDHLESRAIEMAGHFAGLEPLSYQRTKTAMRAGAAAALRSALEQRRGQSVEAP
ncbi:MAG TPA: crotonase/enoyl-CoA hydratase family protein [Acidimicrobiales bacterium]